MLKSPNWSISGAGGYLGRLSEDLLENVRHAGGGILPDRLLFLSEHEKQPLKPFPHDILIQVYKLGLGERDGSKPLGQLFVLARDADLVHGLLDMGAKGGRELGGGFGFEIGSGGGVGP